jgi:hypothetical protein
MIGGCTAVTDGTLTRRKIFRRDGPSRRAWRHRITEQVKVYSDLFVGRVSLPSATPGYCFAQAEDLVSQKTGNRRYQSARRNLRLKRNGD